jgi:hypothetical protein
MDQCDQVLVPTVHTDQTIPVQIRFWQQMNKPMVFFLEEGKRFANDILEISKEI